MARLCNFSTTITFGKLPGTIAGSESARPPSRCLRLKSFDCFRMETLSESASMMLRQFRALLRHSPLPINSNRLLQLTALNMFAIESAQLKEGKNTLLYSHRRDASRQLSQTRICIWYMTSYIMERGVTYIGRCAVNARQKICDDCIYYIYWIEHKNENITYFANRSMFLFDSEILDARARWSIHILDKR